MQLNFDTEHKSRLKFSRLGTWYILALSAIAIVSIIGQILIQQHLADQFNDSQVVNVAGKQRMLSQKITKSVLLLANQSTKEKKFVLSELASATHLWKVSQEGLQRGNDSLHLSGHNSDTLTTLFEKVRDPFQKISISVDILIGKLQQSNLISSAELQPEIDVILTQEDLFLTGMDAIVHQYAQEANEKISGLRTMEYILLFISLFVIGAEVLFIFRPTAIQVSRTVNKLRASEKNSRKLLKEIGALYASLEKSYEQLSAINEPVENPRLFAKTDHGGNVTFVSDTFLQVIMTESETKLYRLSDLFNGMSNSSDWMDDVVDTVSDGKSWQGDIRFQRADNVECWVSIIVQPVQGEGGEIEWVVLGSDITGRKKAEQNMNRKNRAEIEKLVNQQKFRSVLILEGQEEERKRIAMDIHDGIGQMLTSLKYQIESIDFKNPQVGDKIKEIDQLIKNVIKEVRRVTFNLKPTVLGDYGLDAALNVFIKEIAKLTDIKLQYKTSGELDRMPQKMENNIFRIIQEAINNAIKYSKADTIEVELRHDEDILRITVKDKGVGFDTKIVESRSVNIESGRGFFNMYERTEYINGMLNVQSSPGNGTTVALTVPLSTGKYSGEGSLLASAGSKETLV